MTTFVHKLKSMRHREGILAVGASLPALLLGLLVHRQGFNLLDDGLWTLGTGLVADGGILYRDLFSIYGPARYFLLWPFFLVFGHSALALAIAKAVFDALAAACVFVLARRLQAGRMAWLAPLGILAFGPIMPRYVFLMSLVLLVLRRPGCKRGRDHVLVGITWGAAALFGLDTFLYASLVIVGGGLLSSGLTAILRRLPLQLAGVGAVFGAMFLWALSAGCLSAVWWDTIVYPLTRFRGAMGISWLEVLRSAELGLPFSGLYTGEKLAGIFSFHPMWKATALRALYITLWIIPALAAWRLFKRRDDVDHRRTWGFVLALALTGWVTILGRGDVEHLRQAWLGSFCLAAALAAAGERPVLVRSLALVLALLLLGPPLLEKAWLATNTDRDGLVEWNRPQARILVAETRQVGIDALLDRLPAGAKSGDRPVLIWPNLPGLHFLSGAKPATAQVTLLPDEVRNARVLEAELREDPPAAFIVGPPVRSSSHLTDTRDEAPEAWNFLRSNYWLAVTVNAGEDDFRLGLPVEGGASSTRDLSLQDLIPDVEQGMGGGSGPPMRPGLRVGQSFVTSGLGLYGIAVRWLVEPFQAGRAFPVRVSIWQRSVAGGPFDKLLGRGEDEVRLEAPGRRSYYDLRNANIRPELEVAVTFELLQPASGRVTLAMAETGGEGRQVDRYPGGSVVVGGRPLGEDLYFYTW